MTLQGKCADCGADAWLNEDGSCTAGHPRERVSGVVDSEETAAKTVMGVASTATAKVGRMFADLRKPRTPEEIELREARDEYEARVAEAKKALDEASAPLDKEVADARKSLAAAEAIGTKKVGALAGLTLTESWLQTPAGNINLESETVRATVDTAGNIQRTAKMSMGRVVGGAILFGPAGAIVGGLAKKGQTHDTRELYILVESDSTAAVVKCNPDQGAQARQFVTAIHNTAAGAPARARQRADSVAQWTRHLDDLIIRRAQALAGIRGSFSAVEADTACVDIAQAALEASKA